MDILVIDLPETPFFRINSHTLACEFVTDEGIQHTKDMPIDTSIYLTDGEVYQLLAKYTEDLDITIAMPKDKIARIRICR